MNILKIAATSEASSAAGAVANTFREEGMAELQAIGPKAVNQAVKSIAIARGYVASSGVDLFFTPAFVDVAVNDETRTGIRFTVRSRTPVPALRPRRKADEPPPPQTRSQVESIESQDCGVRPATCDRPLESSVPKAEEWKDI